MNDCKGVSPLDPAKCTLAWRLALLGVREEKAQGSLVIAIEGSQTPAGYLNPVMAKELFNNQQKVQQVNEYGRRKVAKCALNPLINVYAKFYPELPGMEEAIRRLAFLLSDSGIVPQERIVLFQRQKNTLSGITIPRGQRRKLTNDIKWRL